jgi:hypothetical protein
MAKQSSAPKQPGEPLTRESALAGYPPKRPDIGL